MSDTPLDVPGILRRYGIRPHKGLGQNFLIDPGSLARVVESADIQLQETVLEIGAGLGSLTRLLAVVSRRVIAVEIDSELVSILQRELVSFPNIELVQGDIMALDPGELIEGDPQAHRLKQEPAYLVVANIPYYITSALIRHLLEAHRQPRRIVLTIQQEVAQRICALPGDMSILAVSVQVYGRPSITAHIPAGAFYPVPQVDSAVLRVELNDKPLIEHENLNDFFRLVKAGFSQKRKTLRNAVSGGMHWSPQLTSDILRGAGIDPSRRAETLSLEEWRELFSFWKANPGY